MTRAPGTPLPGPAHKRRWRRFPDQAGDRLGQQPHRLGEASRPKRIEHNHIMSGRVQRLPRRQVKAPGRLDGDSAGLACEPRVEAGYHRPDPGLGIGEAVRETAIANGIGFENMQVQRRFTYVDPGINSDAVGEGLALYAGHHSPPFVQTGTDGDLTKLRTALKRQGCVRPGSPREKGCNPSRAPQTNQIEGGENIQGCVLARTVDRQRKRGAWRARTLLQQPAPGVQAGHQRRPCVRPVGPAAWVGGIQLSGTTPCPGLEPGPRPIASDTAHNGARPRLGGRGMAVESRLFPNRPRSAHMVRRDSPRSSPCPRHRPTTPRPTPATPS